MSKEQLALFEAAWQARSAESESAAGEDDNDDLDGDAGAGAKPDEMPTLHCCGKDLRLIAEETSERYEYIPASMNVIQDVCLK